MKGTLTTQRQIRDEFWENNPQFKHVARWTQNQYPTDTRLAFCHYVDYLHRSGRINEHLAQKVTL